MTISFILNGEDVEVNAAAETRLVNILRENFNITGAKAGCYAGKCAACSVIFNGNVVKACLIPAFKIRNSEIITMEGFSQTDEYQDIIAGFNTAGIQNCGFCDSGKILAAEALLGRNPYPSKEEIISAFRDISCRCTDPDEIIQGVMAISEYRRVKVYV